MHFLSLPSLAKLKHFAPFLQSESPEQDPPQPSSELEHPR